MTPTTQATAALLTPPGRGGIATIALTGPASLHLLARVFRARPGSEPPHAIAPPDKLQLGEVFDADGPIDEALVAVTPRGLEINLHGGPVGVHRLLDYLARLGAQRVAPGKARPLLDATHPQWNNPAIGEELLAALPGAASLLVVRMLSVQWSAGLSELARTALDELATDRAEQLRQAAAGLEIMRRLTDPPEVVLAGAPNAGKSSLANALIGRDVSIVHDTAGTTRDWVRELTCPAGRPIWLTDTAGLWQAEQDLDAEAVRRAWDCIDQADLVILCTPAGSQPTPLPREIHAPLLAVATKADLAAPDALRAEPLAISTHTGVGLDALRAAMVARLDLAELNESVPRAFTARQAALLTAAADALDAGAIDTAWTGLDTLLTLSATQGDTCCCAAR
jgi:tRNA modification GTPase